MLGLLAAVLAGCSTPSSEPAAQAADRSARADTGVVDADATSPDPPPVPAAADTGNAVDGGATPSVDGAPSSAVARPDWLGTRPLAVTDRGYGVVEATPPELVDRRFVTVDLLDPPAFERFAVTVTPVSDEVVARSTWSPECPVARDDLRYVTLPFWGFDGRLHTGELLVHADAVAAIAAGFEVLFDDGFPIEEMRITTREELDAAPTGDGNNTSAFVCRPSRGATSWSQHAYGRAVDVNPFHNPYVKGDVVLPELAGSYTDRDRVRPGMLDAAAVRGFTAAGWGWGGTWTSSFDPMHLSATGT